MTEQEMSEAAAKIPRGPAESGSSLGGSFVSFVKNALPSAEQGKESGSGSLIARARGFASSLSKADTPPPTAAVASPPPPPPAAPASAFPEQPTEEVRLAPPPSVSCLCVLSVTYPSLAAVCICHAGCKLACAS